MFKVSFEVSATRLEHLLAATSAAGLPGPAIEYVPTQQGPVQPPTPEASKQRRRSPTRRTAPMPNSAILSLTGKVCVKGTMRRQVQDLLEKLESEHGIGKVSRKQLVESVLANKGDRNIVTQLVQDGFIARVS